MLKTVLRLDSEPQICMRYLKSFNFSTTQNNTVHIVIRLPHSGFGLYAPQRISAKVVGSADGKTVLHLSARPLIPTECLIILFNALSVFFIIFTLMRKCAPYFLPAILAFTILLTGMSRFFGPAPHRDHMRRRELLNRKRSHTAKLKRRNFYGQ